ncbi:MAG TPA: hypothetical protein VME17_25525 [Bryobacteraceae bacterium]|nr:hypothetical protein [Bryobacteraceae bacterium]
MQVAEFKLGIAHRRLIAIFKAALILAAIFVIVTPTPPFALGAGLDASWIFGINMGHVARMVFGRDIVFTYGPLGFLLYPTFPEAAPWAVFAFDWGIALLTGYALWMLTKRARHWTEICVYLGVFWVYSAFALGAEIERVLAAIIALTLLVAIRLDEAPWFDLGLLSFLAAVALLAKFNLGVIATFAAFYFTAILAWRRRSWKRAAAVVTIWIVTFGGIYWILDGTLVGIVPFIRYSIAIASGYSEGMALAGPLWIAIGAVLSCFVLWFLVPLASGNLRRLAWGMLPLVAISFLCFKWAMVRQDDHDLPFPFQCAAIALLVVALASSLRSQIAVAIFALGSFAFGAAEQLESANPQLPMERLTGSAALTNVDSYLHWPSTVAAIERAERQALHADQLPPGFQPYVEGKRVAAYPWEIAMIRANHLHWESLPVLQAYSAYTPALDSLNAGALDSAAGPQAILLEWTNLDNHEPFYETPRSWYALLDWYDLKLRSHNWPENVAVLNRRATPRYAAPVLIGTAVAHWNQKITLPPVAEDEGLLMEADTRESIRGFLKSELFRLTPVVVDVRRRSGFLDEARILRENLADGVLVSDWPNSLGPAAAMFARDGSFTTDRVVSITLHPYAPDELEPTIRIRWLRVKLRSPTGHS